jgi:hypothetical protein
MFRVKSTNFSLSSYLEHVRTQDLKKAVYNVKNITQEGINELRSCYTFHGKLFEELELKAGEKHRFSEKSHAAWGIAIGRVYSFTNFQKYVLVGLLLGDSYLYPSKVNPNMYTFNHYCKAERLGFVRHLTFNVLSEWLGIIPAIRLGRAPEKMPDEAGIAALLRAGPLEYVLFSTLPLRNLQHFHETFYNRLDRVGEKEMPFNIKRLLHPIAIAYWFMGGGGKFHNTTNNYISLYLYDFTLSQCIRSLRDDLTSRYGWNVEVILDDFNKEATVYEFRIHNVEDFIDKIGPYIYNDFPNRYNSPSGNKSFRNTCYGNQEIMNTRCGSFYKATQAKYLGLVPKLTYKEYLKTRQFEQYLKLLLGEDETDV